jgi:G:T-mismatch repair DNA endonuclease (very short patch repair protein)
LGLSGRVVLRPYCITDEGRQAWIRGASKTRQLRIERGNYRHTDSARAKLSEATAKAISEGRIKGRSKLEDRVGEVLRSLGLAPVAQHIIRTARGTFACCFDFYFPDRKMALEVNGTFWHSDPRFFPQGPVHEVQKRHAIRWERKLALAKTLGIEVREVWEHDLRMDFAKAVRAVIS